DDSTLRVRYSAAALSRLRIHFVVQEQALGTAHALLTAASLIGDSPLVVLNADNYYPVSGLVKLREAGEPATLAFSRRGLLANGQLEPGRLARYAVVESDAAGYLTDIIEKPDDARLVAREDAAISMNVWRFDERIFDA